MLSEGIIDVLWQHADGSVGATDYETDRVSKSRVTSHAERYALQGGVYALAVQRATASPVSTVDFVFASLEEDGVVRYDGVQVEELITRAASVDRSADLSDVLVAEAFE